MSGFRVLRSLVVSALLLGTLALTTGACVVETEEGTEDDLVATFDRAGNIDLARPTRILLIGDSDKLGELPLHAATSRARRYAELYPNEQIVLFVTKDVKDATVKKTGATVVQNEPFGEGVALSDLSRLSSEKLIAALDRFKKIASIDFFGHSSPFGALLESEGDDRVLSASIPGTAKILADNFVRESNPYVTLNGCNGGVEVAAALSKLWSLPVSGALTASNFHELKSDGHFYVNDTGFFPPNLSRASKNNVSFAAGPAACSAGACIRMKPQDAPYWGVWGNQELGMQYGLGYYKFFCNYADANKSCVKGMASSLYAYVGEKAINRTSSDADVKAVLADFFCSRAKDATWFDTCKAGLENAVANGTAFSPMKTRNDYSLECNFEKCEQKFRCTRINGVPQKKTCVWVAAGCPEGAAPNSTKCLVKNTKKQTTRNEYNAYLEGHVLLRGGNAPPAVTCFSSTLRRTVAENTCVESSRDRKWYSCKASGWSSSDGTTGCSARFPL